MKILVISTIKNTINAYILFDSFFFSSLGNSQDVANNLQSLKKNLAQGEFSALGEIRKTVLQLAPPGQLVRLPNCYSDL